MLEDFPLRIYLVQNEVGIVLLKNMHERNEIYIACCEEDDLEMVGHGLEEMVKIRSIRYVELNLKC